MKRITTIFVFLFSISVGAAEMLGIGKACVFSSVKARILLNGKPVANAKVIRRWNWNSKKSDESVTDENGVVSFPAVFESSVTQLLPVEFVVSQGLVVHLNNEEKVFWSNSRQTPEENAEYAGKYMNLVCELTEDEILIEDYDSLMVTMCKLDNGS